MTRNDLKYFVTALLFVDLCSVAVLGLLMAFVIPSGNVSMGAKVFLGMHRQGSEIVKISPLLTLTEHQVLILALISCRFFQGWFQSINETGLLRK